MKPWLTLASIAWLALFSACDPDGGQPLPNDPNVPGGETKLPERDGIPSDNNADRLLYYMSTQEGATGLHAYRPSTPDTPPVLVDGGLDLRSPFHHAVHGGTIETDGSIRDFHVAGVAYSSNRLGVIDGNLPSLRPEYIHVASTDPSTFEIHPPRVSNHSISSGILDVIGKLFSYTLTDLSQSTLLAAHYDTPVRYDFDMGEDEPALALPQGTPIYSMLGEGSDAHEHWLYLNQDGSLEFYTRDFTSSAPPLDEDTGTALPPLSTKSFAVSHLGVDELLFVAVPKDAESDDDVQGTLYRIARPTAARPGGSSKQLLNAAGEPLVISVGFMASGVGAPSTETSYVRDDVLFFANGPSMFNPVGTTAFRVDRDGWSMFDHLKEIGREDAEMTERILYSSLAPVVIPVDGYGTFWTVGGQTELIEPTTADGSSWKRTTLDAPRPESTTIQTSANGWVYYQGNAIAVAYHVPTKETLRFSQGTWLGASTDGRASDINSLIHSDLAEVFLQLSDGRVAALEATDPKKGMVILGQLPSTAKTLTLSAGGRGPHRLLRLTHEDGSAEVLYVDTRSKGSLVHLMSAPAVQWSYPVELAPGTSIQIQVEPSNTKPVSLF